MRDAIRAPLLMILLLSPAAAGQEPKGDPAALLEKAIQRLGSDDYKEREAATQDLERLPTSAIPLIEAALRRPGLELEVQVRLQRVIPALLKKQLRDEFLRKKDAYGVWSRKSGSEAYDRVGRKDPRWDAPAKEALDAVATLTVLWTNGKHRDPALERRGYGKAKEAFDAGCDDPLVGYARARLYDAAGAEDLREATRLHVEAAHAMRERGTAYHPLRQAFVYARAAEFLSRRRKDWTEADREEIGEWLELAAARYAEGAKDPEVPDRPLLELGIAMTDTWAPLNKDRKPGFDRLEAVLKESRPDGVLPLLLKGEVYTSYAWDARGNGWSNTVSKDGWKLMAERLNEAEASLLKASEKDPKEPLAPTYLITVELGQGKGREVMESWYRRAMEADPDNLEAVHRKMYYLAPQWYGSAEEQLAFARDLAQGANWDARLPFQLIDLHVKLARTSNKGAAYYKDAQVWGDIKSVYEPYLSKRPESSHDRTWYAKLACWSEHYDVARAQFEKLGDKVDVSVFSSPEEMERLKAAVRPR